MKNKRQTEIINSITAFSKDTYYNDEFLDELFDFQRQVINVTFEETHAEKMKLKMYDVQKYLHEKNQELNNVAGSMMTEFDEYCETFNSMIGRKIAGQKGETQLFRTLEILKTENHVLKNIELKCGDNKAELDAVVITSKAVFLVEVKNPTHDMIIDSRGNYYRAYGYINQDYNIGEKVNNKEYLLRKVIIDSEMAEDLKAIPVINLVVFANSKMKCENRFKYIDVCYLSNLPYIIRGYENEHEYSLEEIRQVAEVIETAQCKEAYQVNLDFGAFKRCIAEIVVALEKEAKKTEEKDKASEAYCIYKPSIVKAKPLEFAGTMAMFAAGVLAGYVYKRL